MNLQHTFFLFFLFGITLNSIAQTTAPTREEAIGKFGFKEYAIVTKTDTTWFYLYQKQNSRPTKLVLYLQGTSPDPLFTVELENGNYHTYRWFPDDYKNLDESYCYAIIGKTGIPSIAYEEIRDFSWYHEKNSLHHRVFQANAVINYLTKNLIKSPKKIIVYGHSEGAPVAAKLGTVNKRITHLGFWAGNALPDYYDFLLQNSKANYTKQISDSVAYANTQKILDGFKKIEENKNDVSFKSKHSYTSKRWWSYAEPPINHLLKITIPIFVQVAGKDENAPIESTYLLPLEFIRLGKKNLRYEICAECDHGFNVAKATGEKENRWTGIFQEFIRWTNG